MIYFKRIGLKVTDLEDNQAIIAKLSGIDPNTFSYDEFKRVTGELGIQISEFTEAMEISANLPKRTADKNNGILGTRYFHFLIGMIAIKQQATLSEIED